MKTRYIWAPGQRNYHLGAFIALFFCNMKRWWCLGLSCILLLPTPLHAATSLPCDPLKTSHGISCLCTLAYCDTVPEIPNTLGSNEYIIYTSSKSGSRLKEKLGTFKELSRYSEPDRKVNVRADVEFQKIHGFGNALTDAAILNYNKMDPRLQKTILKQYWGADNKGAKFNVARIPISSTDFSTHVYSYDDKTDDYNLENLVYRWTTILKLTSSKKCNR